MISILLILILCSAAEVKSGCVSSTYPALLQLSSVQYFSYSNNDDCVISIIPATLFRRGYYLEIKWVHFDIEGNLPICKDYVEVYLTRHKRSIGRYCSGNTGSSQLFNMYSSDGYATIRFKSDNSITKGGFKFSFQLKSVNSSNMGPYGQDICYYTKEAPYHGIFFSSGWPRGYTSGNGLCYKTYPVPKGKEMRIAVMDLDLRDNSLTCDEGNDYFQIRVSSTLYKGSSFVKHVTRSLTSKHCGTFHPGYFTSKHPYVYLIINKPFGSFPLYFNRGFMMGHIIYNSVSSKGAKFLVDGCTVVIIMLISLLITIK